jgi:hypothetical protein
MPYLNRIYQERTTLRSWIIAIIFAVLGVAGLFFSTFPGFTDYWSGKELLRQLVFGLGFFLLAPIAIGVLWELFIRRAFVDEIINRLRIAEEVRSAGIVGYTDNFNSGIDWDSYFKNASKLDILFSYGTTWRNMNEGNFKEFINRGGEIRVVLPDPDDDDTVSELARRFYYEQDQLHTRINEAIKFFKDLKSGKKDAKIDVWLLNQPLLFSFYKFDNTIIMALFRHGSGRGGVPTIITQSGGRLYDFVSAEFDGMIQENGLARKLTND